MARARARRPAIQRIGFFAGIAERDADELLGAFIGAPDVRDPRLGHVTDETQFRDYVSSTREWISEQNGGRGVALTRTSERTCEELAVLRPDPDGDLPVAVAD